MSSFYYWDHLHWNKLFAGWLLLSDLIGTRVNQAIRGPDPQMRRSQSLLRSTGIWEDYQAWAGPFQHSWPWLLTLVELTLLFGLEAFELQCAFARFPGFLVWTGEEWETPFLWYFRILSSCPVPKGGSSDRGKGSIQSHYLQAIRPPLLPWARLPWELIPATNTSPLLTVSSIPFGAGPFNLG
jgi:hypothetical protein